VNAPEASREFVTLLTLALTCTFASDLRSGKSVQVEELKAVKNRLHLDICVGGGREFPIETRRKRVDAEAERLAGLGASYVRVLSQAGLDHYGIAMQDPEGNEFDIN